jgi:hypothetical protein
VHVQIRGVEIGIVVLVLMVWAGAIGLFFNRWGKIRMLLPYQPDYKQDQLKVPGTTNCPPGQCNGHQHQVKSKSNFKILITLQRITNFSFLENTTLSYIEKFNIQIQFISFSFFT